MTRGHGRLAGTSCPLPAARGSRRSFQKPLIPLGVRVAPLLRAWQTAPRDTHAFRGPSPLGVGCLTLEEPVPHQRKNAAPAGVRLARAPC